MEYAPGTPVGNDELPVPFQNIERRTGITCRHIAAPEDTVESIALEAGRQLFEALTIQGEDCGGLVLSSCAGQSKDLNKTADSVAHQLNIRGKTIGINFACSGFPAATEKALELCSDQEKHIVVITAEMLSRLADWRQENIAILVGDRAAATTVHPNGPHEILEARAGFINDPQELLDLRRVDDALDAQGNTGPRDCILMDGAQLYRRAPADMLALVEASLKRLGLGLADLSTIVQHQANGRFAQKLRKLLSEKDGGKDVYVVDEIARMGNVGSSSIPCALTHIQDDFADGQIISCPAVGAGPDWKRGQLSQGIVTFRASAPEG